MLPESVILQSDLLKIIKRFIADENRGISVNMFCELAGINPSTLRDVFVHETCPMSEYVQRRVSKAYQSWINGEVAIMQNRDTSKYLEYRKDPRPRFAKTQRLKVVNGKIQLDLGIRRKYDYSAPTLDEQMEQ